MSKKANTTTVKAKAQWQERIDTINGGKVLVNIAPDGGEFIKAIKVGDVFIEFTKVGKANQMAVFASEKATPTKFIVGYCFLSKDAVDNRTKLS